MIKSWLHKIRRASRRLWVRVMLIAGLSLVAIGLAQIFGSLIPPELAEMAGAEALDQLLTILANSMLGATTFSLTVMVTVHRAVAQSWTPRAHRSLLQDPTTQTVLATFVGAYIYAVASIILTSTPLFGEREVFALYITTVIVIALIVFVILRWILHLQTLGSLMDTAGRIETEAHEQMDAHMRRPCLGGRPWTEPGPPEGAVPVRAEMTAYVQEIHMDSLQEAAAACDARIHVEAPVGRFVHRGTVLAWMTPERPGLAGQVATAIHTGALRTATQDPRFGLIQLAEIGCKALSPGINDAGTPIDIVGRLARLLLTEAGLAEPPGHDRVWIRPLSPDDLIEDAFAALSRDAGASVEVHIAIVKTLNALADLAEPGIASAARRYADTAHARAEELIPFAPDRARLPRPTGATG